MSEAYASDAPARFLVARSGAVLCALPIAQVAETMRPLPVEPLGSMPAFVLGISIIRGVPVPVVDCARLLGAGPGAPGRYLTLKPGGERHVALAVDAVLGVRDLAQAAFRELPPLLREAGAETLAALSALDAELLVCLHGARLVPESVYQAVESGVVRP